MNEKSNELSIVCNNLINAITKYESETCKVSYRLSTYEMVVLRTKIDELSRYLDTLINYEIKRHDEDKKA